MLVWFLLPLAVFGVSDNTTNRDVHSIDFAPLSKSETTVSIEKRVNEWLAANRQRVSVLYVETLPPRVFGVDAGPVYTVVTAGFATYILSAGPSHLEHELYETTFMDVWRVWYDLNNNTATYANEDLHTIDFWPVSTTESAASIEQRINAWQAENRERVQVLNVETIQRVFGVDSGPVFSVVTAGWATQALTAGPSHLQHDLYETTFMDVQRVWYYNLTAAPPIVDPTPQPKPVPPIITTNGVGKASPLHWMLLGTFWFAHQFARFAWQKANSCV